MKGVLILKKRISAFISAIALLDTGAASMGCIWMLADEPNTITSFED